MLVLVTGGAGFIGSHVAKSLAEAGHEPLVLDNLTTGYRWAVKWGRLIEGSTGDRDLVLSLLRKHRPDAIVHLAGSAYVGESMERPDKYFENNSVNSLTLLSALIEDGARPFVFSSTCATYGLPEVLPITESSPQSPTNPYGESKLIVEKALRWYGQLKALPYAALRYFNAAGADPEGELGEVHEPETHLIPRVLQVAQGSLPSIGVFGTDYQTPDGTAIRDYVHVSDLAAAHVRALEILTDDPHPLEVNLGTGRGHSVRQIVETAEAVTGRSIPVEEMDRRVGDPGVLVADASLAEKLLTWTPQNSDLERIIATAWEWESRRPR